MKKTGIKILVLLGLSLFIGTAPAYAVSDTITATAIIQAGTLTVTGQTDLDFGTITLAGGANTVTVDASSGAAVPSVTVGTAAVNAGGSGLVEVSTNVDADVTIVYSIVSVPTGTADVLESPANDTIAISNIAGLSTASPYSITVAGSPNPIHVGGEITIPAGQAAGTYSGTLTVDVNY